MPDVPVTFLEQPQVGRAVRILYNGQVGDTAVVTAIELEPRHPGVLRVTTQTGVVCVGRVNPQPTQAMGPSGSVRPTGGGNSFLRGLGLGAGIPVGCGLGCVGLFVGLVILGVLVGGLSGSGGSDSAVITRADLGDEWPLTVEGGTVRYDRGVLFDADNGVTYAVNGTAVQNHPGLPRITDVQAADPDYPPALGIKKDLGPIIDRGLELRR